MRKAPGRLVLMAAGAALTVLTVYALVGQRPVTLAAANKLLGGDQPCPWPALLRSPWSRGKFARLQKETQARLLVERRDPALPIDLIRTGGRSFWIKRDGVDKDGAATLAYVLAEQEWIAAYSVGNNVRPGDVVVDVGAHVGTFDDDALRRGASKTILVEPDPLNVECIRRNFSREIAEGRVAVIPEGAWSSRGALEFSLGVSNSGTGSFVVRENGPAAISVPVRPLDEMLAELGIGKVDFIKMDVEGAEREVIRGARETLRRWKPRLMLDHYHLPDDNVALPRAIREANAAYTASCDVCSPDRQGHTGRYVPYIVFYR